MGERSIGVKLSLPVLERLQNVIIDECNRVRCLQEAYGRQLSLTPAVTELTDSLEIKNRYREELALWEDAYLAITEALVDEKNNRAGAFGDLKLV